LELSEIGDRVLTAVRVGGAGILSSMVRDQPAAGGIAGLGQSGPRVVAGSAAGRRPPGGGAALRPES